MPECPEMAGVHVLARYDLMLFVYLFIYHLNPNDVGYQPTGEIFIGKISCLCNDSCISRMSNYSLKLFLYSFIFINWHGQN